MDSVELIKRLHQHRMWVNQKLIAATGSLSDQQLHQSIPIGQGSVWRTLTHLLAAEFVWLEALTGNESPLLPGDVPDQLPGNQQGEDRINSVAELKTRWAEPDQRWNQYLQSLSNDSLTEIVYKISTSSGLGKRHGTSRADVLLHVCTHAQYTTAQLINMLRQLSVANLPDVMLISMARAGN